VSEVVVFDAVLDPYSADSRVTRRLALRADETLVALHRLIQEAFEWNDDHLYSFWLDGTFWGDKRSEYTAPFELEESGAASADVEIGRLGLERGQRVAYVFDFGDEWRVALRVREIRDGGETGILAREGDPPPQYPDYEDEE
jgi:Plasmid pRiA4b ORF-3-like protein